MQTACYQRSGNEIQRDEIIQHLQQRAYERIGSIEIFLAERNMAGSSTAKSVPADRTPGSHFLIFAMVTFFVVAVVA
jgi:hypothetical protein